MRKIIVTEYLTLDGVFEEPGHWSFDYWNEESMQYKRDELFSSDVQFVLGSGKRLFTEGTEKFKLTLVDTKSFKTGIVVLHYQPDKDNKGK